MRCVQRTPPKYLFLEQMANGLSWAVFCPGAAICLTIEQWFGMCLHKQCSADYAAESKNQSHSAHHSSRSPNPTYAAHLSLLLASVTRALSLSVKNTEALQHCLTHLPLLPFTGPQQAFEQI